MKLQSLNSRLAFWFLVVSLVPLAGAATLTYFQRVDSIKDEAFHKLSAIRDLKVRELDNWISERQGDLRTAAGDFEIRSLGGPLHEPMRSVASDEAIHAARELFQRVVENYQAFSEVFLVDARTGRVAISSDPGQEGRSCSQDPYFTVPCHRGITA